jgi:hypothetical protein
VLTNRCAATYFVRWPAAYIGAAIILSVMTFIPAFAGDAGGISDTSCVGSWKGFNCVTRSGPAGDPYVRLVPEPLGEAEKARLAAHDRKWMARCHPVIEHDRYGVARYRYSAPGCEFGVSED